MKHSRRWFLILSGPNPPEKGAILITELAAPCEHQFYRDERPSWCNKGQLIALTVAKQAQTPVWLSWHKVQDGGELFSELRDETVTLCDQISAHQIIHLKSQWEPDDPDGCAHWLLAMRNSSHQKCVNLLREKVWIQLWPSNKKRQSSILKTGYFSKHRN